MSVQNVEIKKNIRVFSNGVWKEQPHLDFLFNLCQRKDVWFEYHIKQTKLNGTTQAGGFTFKLIH